MSNASSGDNLKKRSEDTFQRLVLAFIRIILGLVTTCFFLYFLSMDIEQFVEGEAINNQVQQFIAMTTFVNQIRIESEISFYFMRVSPNVSTTLLQQQSTTKQALQNLIPTLKKLSYSQIGPILFMLGNLETVQNLVINQSGNFSETITWYYDLNDAFYEVLNQMVFVEDVILAKELNTMLYFHCYLDWMSKEAILIATVLVTGVIENDFCREYWSIRQAQSLYYLQTQLCAPPSVQTEFFLNPDQSYQSALTNIENTRRFINQSISTRTAPPPSLTTTINWWSNMTVIMAYTAFDSLITSYINAAIKSIQSGNQVNMILAIFGAVFETLAAVQLALVAIPIFLLAFSWRRVNYNSESKT